MKWYSIKKYRPPTGNFIFIRIELGSGQYDRNIVAMCEDLNEVKNAAAWEVMANDALDIDLSLYKVTHFCIPDPVEIENL